MVMCYPADQASPTVTLQRWGREVQRYCDSNVTVVVLALMANPSNPEALREATQFARENLFQHYELNNASAEACRDFFVSFIENILPTVDAPQRRSSCLCVLL